MWPELPGIVGGFEIEWHMMSYGGDVNFFHNLVWAKMEMGCKSSAFGKEMDP